MANDLPNPESRKEAYLAKAAGMDVEIPEQPESRLEQYLNAIADGGGGTSDFNELDNRPKYNGTAMTGETNIPAIPNVVQTTGTSTTDIMSQNAMTSMLYADPSTKEKIKIGSGSILSRSKKGIAIGDNSVNGTSGSEGNISIGYNSSISGQVNGCIAIGARSGSNINGNGMVDLGTSNTSYGYNSSNYRLLTGLYDGQSAHDAATKGQLDSIAIQNAGAPTTATVGTVGMLYEDTTNGKLYQCTAIDTTDPQNPSYTWAEVGGSSINVVQSSGTSTTDVMSQNAVTSMLYADPGVKNKVRIGGWVYADGDVCTAIGLNARARGNYSLALNGRVEPGADFSTSIGAGAMVEPNVKYSVALGAHSHATMKGQVDISTLLTTNTEGYNDSQYRLLTGLYDGQSLHDAATVAQGNTLSTSAPTTATAGVLGQLYTDTTNMHTYQCTAIDTTDPDNPSYTWTQRW